MTTNTGLNQPAYNSTSPTWDQPLNYNETILDSILGNTTSVAMPTGASTTTTLTGPVSSGTPLGQTQAMRIVLTGALSANQTLQFPSGVGGRWIIYNTTTGSYTVTISSAGGGNSIIAPQNGNVSIYSDGTNIRYTDDGLVNNFATLTVLGNTYLATASGNVGIGTSSPTSKITMQTTGQNPLTLRTTTTNLYDAATIYLNTSGSSANQGTVLYHGIQSGSDSSTTSFQIQGYGNNYTYNSTWYIVDYKNNLQQWFTNNTERMRIDSNGNVGIGTSTPSSLLTVNGAISASGAVSASSFSGSGSGLTGTASSLSIGGTASNITSYTINQSLGTSNVPTFAGLLATGDITTYRSYSTSTGVIFFGNGGSHYLLFDGSNYQLNAASLIVGGSVLATGNVVAYYSDDRLKTKLGGIDNALGKVRSLSGFYYEANEKAQELGYEVVREVGVSAQSVQAIMPEVVAPAPIDAQYLTVRYERLVPLLIEAIKELSEKVEQLEKGND